ncbi:hypothetical protein QDP68_10370, partial [Moraxella porci]
MESFDTLVEGINELKKQGYAEDFNLKQNCIECRNGEYKIFHKLNLQSKCNKKRSTHQLEYNFVSTQK